MGFRFIIRDCVLTYYYLESIMKNILLFICAIASTSLYAGDIELGKSKTAMCVACHGADGNSMNPTWPKLAGQHEDFTSRQLQLFKSGERKGTVMPGMVAGLSEEDMENIGAYYASLKINTGSADESLVVLGKSIYQGGSSEMNIPACMACHGASGRGMPLSGYPALAGQHAAYLQQRLKAYRAGETVANEDDVNGNVMASVAKYLSDEEIEAVSSYLQGLYSK
jgi:cytochrome c553